MAKTHDATRRVLLKKAVYVAPMVLTLQATSAIAKSGSEKEPRKSTKDQQKPKKLKLPKKAKKN